jgi:DNA gyrase/topoisomerase IV subunit B
MFVADHAEKQGRDRGYQAIKDEFDITAARYPKILIMKNAKYVKNLDV